MGKSLKITQTFRKCNFWKFFAQLDTVAEICRQWTDDVIISQLISLSTDDKEVVHASEPLPSVSTSQAENAVHILRWFKKCLENVKIDDFANIF